MFEVRFKMSAQTDPGLKTLEEAIAFAKECIRRGIGVAEDCLIVDVLKQRSFKLRDIPGVCL